MRITKCGSVPKKIGKFQFQFWYASLGNGGAYRTISCFGKKDGISWFDVKHWLWHYEYRSFATGLKWVQIKLFGFMLTIDYLGS